METIIIRTLTSEDSVAEITSLLHAAYARLGALGFNYTAVDQSEDITRERLKDGDCFIACEGKRLIGTIVYHRHSGGCRWYDLPQVGVIHQLGVLPAGQSSGVGGRLIEAAEARARETGAEELALDTSEGAHHLIEWYQHLGYRIVDHVQWEGKTYRSVIMSKALQ